MEEYEKAREAYIKLKDGVHCLEKELRTVAGYLTIKGDGEISIFKKV